MDKNQIKFEISKQVQIAHRLVGTALSKTNLTFSIKNITTVIKTLKMQYLYASVIGRYNGYKQPFAYYFKEGKKIGYSNMIKEIMSVNKTGNFTTVLSLALLGLDITIEIVAIPLISKLIPDGLARLAFDTVRSALLIASRNYEINPDAELEAMAHRLDSNLARFTTMNGFKYAYKANLGKTMIALPLVTTLAEETSKEIAQNLGINKQYFVLQAGFESFVYIMTAKSLTLALKLRLPSIIMNIAASLLHTNPKLKKYAYILHFVFNAVAVALTPTVAKKITTNYEKPN